MQTIKDLIPDAMSKLATTPASKLSGWTPSLDAYDPSLVEARDACARLVADMEAEREPYWLTLTGQNGCGKTMLMKQVYEQAKRINPGNPTNNPIWPPSWEDFPADKVNIYSGSRPYCVWLTESSLARRMREGEYDLPSSLRGDHFVALDELGASRDPTNFIADAISQLCDNRLTRWGMFATNLKMQEVAERIDARVASRIIRDGNRIITIKVLDYALRRK